MRLTPCCKAKSAFCHCENGDSSVDALMFVSLSLLVVDIYFYILASNYGYVSHSVHKGTNEPCLLSEGSLNKQITPWLLHQGVKTGKICHAKPSPTPDGAQLCPPPRQTGQGRAPLGIYSVAVAVAVAATR